MCRCWEAIPPPDDDYDGRPNGAHQWHDGGLERPYPFPISHVGWRETATPTKPNATNGRLQPQGGGSITSASISMTTISSRSMTSDKATHPGEGPSRRRAQATLLTSQRECVAMARYPAFPFLNIHQRADVAPINANHAHHDQGREECSGANRGHEGLFIYLSPASTGYKEGNDEGNLVTGDLTKPTAIHLILIQVKCVSASPIHGRGYNAASIRTRLARPEQERGGARCRQ